MFGFLKDLRFSARSLARAPGLAAALVITIAIGLGSNVTVLGFIRGLTTRNGAVASNGHVVSLFGRDAYRGPGPLSYDDYVSLKQRMGGLAWMGAARVSQRAVKVGDQSETAAVAEVTPEVARLFGLRLEGGLAIGHRFWQSELGGNAKIPGQAVRVAGVDTVASEVGPDGLDGVYGDRPIDVWMAMDEGRLAERDRAARNVWVLAGLSPGDSAGRVERAANESGVAALPYTGMAPDVAAGLERMGTLLRIAAGFVFFIGCVNVASFLLGRASLRKHETSVRVALGVSRGRLARALLTDSVVIAVAGAAVSVVLARWTSEAIPSLLFDKDAQFLALAPSWASIAAACAAGAGIVAACGLLPWLGIRSDRPFEVLGRRDVGPTAAARAVRAGLVVVQMGCCCLLATCTGYLYAGFRTALESGVSQRLGRPILATVQAHRDMYVDLGYFRNVASAAQRLEGVTGAAWAARLPGSEAAWRQYRIEPRGLPQRSVQMDASVLPADWADRFSWPAKSGRMFGYKDVACPAAIVNEEAAAELFGDDTVGRLIRDGAGATVQVVGVVARKKRGGAPERGRPMVYYDGRNGAAARAGTRFSAARATELESAEMDTNVVSAGYFGTMGFSVVAGHAFANDRGERGCRVAVVNQEAADSYFGGNAVGAAVIDELGERTEIVGVVHAAQLGVFTRRTEPAVYLPMAQDCLPTMTLVLGTRAQGGPGVAEVKDAVEQVAGRGLAPVVKTMETYLRQTALAPLHIATAIVGTCAAMAVFLGVLGLYGALNDAARARRRDVAIRIAMGARRRDVIGQVLAEGARLAGVGSLAGVVASLMVAQVLPRIAFGVGRPALWVWIAGPAVLGLAVAAASVFPARRSLMVDPLRVLQDG